jgi:hypothetical protein
MLGGWEGGGGGANSRLLWLAPRGLPAAATSRAQLLPQLTLDLARALCSVSLSTTLPATARFFSRLRNLKQRAKPPCGWRGVGGKWEGGDKRVVRGASKGLGGKGGALRPVPQAAARRGRARRPTATAVAPTVRPRAAPQQRAPARAQWRHAPSPIIALAGNSAQSRARKRPCGGPRQRPVRPPRGPVAAAAAARPPQQNSWHGRQAFRNHEQKQQQLQPPTSGEGDELS